MQFRFNFDDSSGTMHKWIIVAALASVMGVTRLGHFGEFAGLPDASWAVFFLAGLWLADMVLFGAFFLLAWIIDLAAVALGTPADCFSPAYLFLIPAYGSLWIAGIATSRLSLAPVTVAVGAAAAFSIANLGMYLSASDPALTALAYVEAVAGYFPHYLLTMAGFVAAGLGAAVLLQSRTPAAQQ